MPESEVTSEQASSAKDGNLFRAERNVMRVPRKGHRLYGLLTSVRFQTGKSNSLTVT